MKMFEKYIWNTRIDTLKSEYIWNVFAGLLNAVEAVIFSMFLTRTGGLWDAGIVMLGFAVGNLMCTIGKYGVRSFQVTDVNREYSFETYFQVRIFTIVIMMLANMFYLFYCFHSLQYSTYKMVAIGVLCMRYVVEAFEDVFAGECQFVKRLDVASKIYIIRCLSFITAFLIIYMIFGRLLTALGLALLLCICVEVYLIRKLSQKMQINISFHINKNCGDLIKKCFPLFLSSFFFYYITSAPKYAIDRWMDDAVQACYGFVAYPVFAIELLNNFLYQPKVVNIANAWNTKKYQELKRAVYRQICAIAILTAAALAFAYVFGIPLLSAIFSTDLTAYKREMLGLILGGGMLAVIGFLSTILIMVRRSRLMIYGYCIIFFLSLWIYTPAILKYGVMGTVAAYFSLCFLLSMYEYIAIVAIFKNEENKNRNSANK